MRSLPVIVPTIKDPIQPSPGFEKKELSTYKLDILGLCGMGCVYCSSNNGRYLTKHRGEFASLTEEQLGQRLLPSDEPALTFVWPDVVANLERQLAKKSARWGAGRTLVFSMLTDAFSPVPLQNGLTEVALRIVLERTSFRVRILTKNCIVGSAKWISLFSEFPCRIVVGLSTGTDDDEWARKVEVGTSSPTSRLRAVRRLQEAGVPTYGMLCPIFPACSKATASSASSIRSARSASSTFGRSPTTTGTTGTRCARHTRRSQRSTSGSRRSTSAGIRPSGAGTRPRSTRACARRQSAKGGFRS